MRQATSSTSSNKPDGTGLCAVEGLLGRAGTRSATAAGSFWLLIWSLEDADFNAVTCGDGRYVTWGSKVGRSDSDGRVTLVNLIGTLCLAEIEDEIRPKSSTSLFKPVRMGGFRGMGGAGFRVAPELGSERGGKGDTLDDSPSSKAEFCGLS